MTFHSGSIQTLHFKQWYLKTMNIMIWIIYLCGSFMATCIISETVEWREYEHHLYFFSKEERTWKGSYERCEELDSTLVTVLSEGENSFLRGYFWTGYVQGDLQCDCLNRFSIHCMECRQSWRWYDGSEVTYMNWAYNSPTRPDYACSAVLGGVWYDCNCDNKIPFVCKKAIRFNACEGNLCAAGSTCEPVPDDTYRCICPDGNEGRHCDVQINECASSPCQNNGNCKDRVNGFECYCPQRYTGVFCERDTEFNATTTTMPFTITVEQSSPLIQFQSQSTTVLPAASSTVENNEGQQADSENNSKENGLNRNESLYIVTGGIVLLLLVIATLVIAITSLLKYRKLGQRENEIVTQYESIPSAMRGSGNVENTDYQYLVHPDYLTLVPEPQQQTMSSSNPATNQYID